MSDFCQNSGGNTGIGQCDLSSSSFKVVGFLFTPKNATIPVNQTGLMDFLDGKFKQDTKATRWFPVMGIQQAADNSEEAQIATLGYGYTEKMSNGNAIYLFDVPFKLCKAKTIIPFDGWSGGIYPVLSSGRLLGRLSLDKQEIIPVKPKDISVTNAQLLSIGGTDARVVSIQINFGDKLEFTQKAAVLSIENFDSEAFEGLQDVELSTSGQSSVGFVDVKVQTTCGNSDLFDVYQNELAVVSSWKLIDAEGQTVVITSIAPQADTKTFRISTSSSGTMTLSLAPISDLEDAGILNVESNSISVTINPAP